MTEQETRDAYFEVVVELPNGKKLRGKPVMYPDAMRLMAMSEEFATQGTSLVPMVQEFHKLTGVPATAPELQDITLGEMVDVINRFFFQRRPEKVPVSAPEKAPALV